MPAHLLSQLFAATAACVVLTAPAFAQSGDTSSPPATAGGDLQPGRGIRVDSSGQPYRPWDVAVSNGFQFDNDRNTWVPGGYTYDDWEGGWGLQVDIGRYWTSHFKTEASAGLLTDRHQYGYEDLVVNGRPAQATWLADGRRGYIGGAVTWQFLNNAFAHPFVSAGVRANVVALHRTRQPYAWSWVGGPSTSFPIPAIDERTTLWQARPYVATGYKSYFYNERAFMRSELSVGFAPSGLSNWGVRIGVGFDF